MRAIAIFLAGAFALTALSGCTNARETSRSTFMAFIRQCDPDVVMTEVTQDGEHKIFKATCKIER